MKLEEVATQAFAKELEALLNKYKIDIGTHWDENFILRPMFDHERLKIEIYEDPDSRLDRFRMRIS